MSLGPPPPSSLLNSAIERVKDAIWAISSSLTACLGQRGTQLKINGRTYSIVRLLGEGGFSYVYLAKDEGSDRLFALKKIRCPPGGEGVKEVMREVEAYRRFKHPNIIRILDSAVVQDPHEEAKVVYLFLPFYRRGNLQDQISANAINNAHFPERDMLLLFRGACLAVQAMHTYRLPSVRATRPSGPQATATYPPRGVLDPDPDDGESSVPLMGGGIVFDGDEEAAREGEEGEMIPYAHRDIKPANVMVADDGVTPILMDFGSTIKARIPIASRQEALIQQDLAAEQSSMPYRAPELFDVKTNTTLDEKVDIWSLGCTLYALAFSHSPFEDPRAAAQGGSVAMAVQSGRYSFPSAGNPYSQGFRKVVEACLNVDPKARPDVQGVIELVDRALGALE